MLPAAQGYTGDLDSAVHRTHTHFDRWKREHAFPDALGGDVLEHMQLAVHEWIAHLARHADFGTREPKIRVYVWPEEDQLCCTVEDNSTGFFLKEADEATEAPLRALAERRVEIALLLGVTEYADYQRMAEGRYALHLGIAPASTDAASSDTTSDTSPDPAPPASPPRPAGSQGLADWQIILSQSG